MFHYRVSFLDGIFVHLTIFIYAFYRDNTVTCCKKCNGKKGSTLPSELLHVKGMKLIREPRVPTKLELAREAEKMVPRSVHPTWRPYLGLGMKPKGELEGTPGDGEELEGIA